MSLSQPLRISTLCHPALFFDAPNLQVLKMGFVQCRCLPCLLSEYISRSTAKLGEEKVELGGGKADLGFSCGLPSPRPCLSLGGKRKRRVSRTLWAEAAVSGCAGCGFCERTRDGRCRRQSASCSAHQALCPGAWLSKGCIF